MRDVVGLRIILGYAPFCLFYPYFGILMWAWIAYFNPHRFNFGGGTQLPFRNRHCHPEHLGHGVRAERDGLPPNRHLAG